MSSQKHPRRILDLAAVWRDTQKGLVRRGLPQRPLEIYDYPLEVDLMSHGGSEASCCTIALSCSDCLEAAVRVASASEASGKLPLLLNFASKNLPGGAVASGVLAQEETIFRRTGLSSCLNPGTRPPCYPLPQGRCVISRSIAVVKSVDYTWLPEPFVHIDVITSAAQQKPSLTGDSLRYGDPAEMKMRSLAVLQAAVCAGSRHLVLGAWGCGGFRNPALGLAEIFRDLLLEEGYGACFDYVEFAIPDEKHAVHFRAAFEGALSPIMCIGPPGGQLIHEQEPLPRLDNQCCEEQEERFPQETERLPKV